MTVAQTFAQFAVSMQDSTLTPQVVHHAKRAIIDWYAALLPGAVEPPATLLEKSLREDLDRGDARLALGRATTVRTAALINATAAHTVEVDDIYREAIYHPGAPTIAAALAIAQAQNSDGMAFIRGVVSGYEVSTRIGRALGRNHYRYWHNTGTVGTFGAAAAAATLLKLDVERYAHALCTCATFAAGLQQAFRMDSHSKPLHAGHAADAGVLAALAASQGVTGSLDVLDGTAGMGRAMSGDVDWSSATSTLGREFNITRMTFKNHACCGHTFSPIDAALALRAQLNLPWQQIGSIEIATYGPALEVAGNPAPITAAEARFSIPFVVATAMIHGKVRLSAFSKERLADPDIRQLMSRVRLKVDPDMDKAFPGRRSALVTITTQDGQQTTFMQPDRKGDPELPLTDADLSDKFLELAAPVIGPERSRTLLDQLWSLEDCTNLSRL